MTLCVFVDNKCVRCGVERKPPYPRRNCHPGLGDMVAAGLSAVGITKKRVSNLVGGDCGCAERQEALNEFGRRLGIGR
jgi:hypothetical protein